MVLVLVIVGLLVSRLCLGLAVLRLLGSEVGLGRGGWRREIFLVLRKWEREVVGGRVFEIMVEAEVVAVVVSVVVWKSERGQDPGPAVVWSSGAANLVFWFGEVDLVVVELVERIADTVGSVVLMK